jgi:hypothetical protein
MTNFLGGKFPGLPRPIAGEYSKGWNLYFPFPYARHCKITSDKGDFYFHVNYRTYAEGTAVESFQASQLKFLTPRIDRLVGQHTGEVPAGVQARLRIAPLGVREKPLRREIRPAPVPGSHPVAPDENLPDFAG